jgi:hypothetical protein
MTNLHGPICRKQIGITEGYPKGEYPEDTNQQIGTAPGCPTNSSGKNLNCRRQAHRAKPWNVFVRVNTMDGVNQWPYAVTILHGPICREQIGITEGYPKGEYQDDTNQQNGTAKLSRSALF